MLRDTLWRGCWAAGEINDEDAAFLSSYIDRRSPPRNTVRTAPGRNIGMMAGRIGARWRPREHPRSPDRKASRERRRMWSGSGHLPPQLRQPYTQGQAAVLAIIANEVKRHGVCDSPVDKIAALAGVCRTTVQTTLHKASVEELHIKITYRPRPPRKHLTNIIEIVSREWRAWIIRGKMEPTGPNSVKNWSPTKNTVIKERGGRWGREPNCPRPSSASGFSAAGADVLDRSPDDTRCVSSRHDLGPYRRAL